MLFGTFAILKPTCLPLKEVKPLMQNESDIKIIFTGFHYLLMHVFCSDKNKYSKCGVLACSVVSFWSYSK